MALDLSVDKLLEMRGKPVFDREGEKIGSIEDIYIDDETRQPEWLGLGTGFLGMRHAIVPLVDASLREDGIAVPYPKDRVKDAPDSEGDDISAEKEAELAQYYSIGTTQAAPTETTGTATPPGERTTTMPPAEAVPPPSDAGVTMTRAEEELHVGKKETSAGRVTLHKYVETEPVSEDVELQHETARVERQPVNRPLRPGEDLGEDETTLRLKREEPVVEKSARTKEEFYVTKESEPTTERVTGEVQKERVDIENDDGTPRP
ncbi:MAG TPA: PRC and DUF2382 domain-containing protein [Dehalococcoidia bacterium]|nr:PRC and DUF2382 domain-containing protein [Dehalococcoidia bacterium]